MGFCSNPQKENHWMFHKSTDVILWKRIVIQTKIWCWVLVLRGLRFTCWLWINYGLLASNICDINCPEKRAAIAEERLQVHRYIAIGHKVTDRPVHETSLQCGNEISLQSMCYLWTSFTLCKGIDGEESSTKQGPKNHLAKNQLLQSAV